MDWYEIDQFIERLNSIEEFFIQIAANEEELLRWGLYRAQKLPNFDIVLDALRQFNEDFSTLKRYALLVDKSLGQQLELLDTQDKLSEQVSLINLRLRMSKVRKPGSRSIIAILQGLIYSTRDRGIFGDTNTPLDKTIINVGRLRSTATVLKDLLMQRQTNDDELFKPSNVNQDRVIDLIDAVLKDLTHLTSLSASERQRLEGYLNEAKEEILTRRPSWSKVVGALVIVAAITSGMADAPTAAKNLKYVIEYILGTSVEKPLRQYLPPPSETEKVADPTTTKT